MKRNALKEPLRLMAYRKLKLTCCRDGGFKARLSFSDLEKINALIDERNRLLLVVEKLIAAKNKAVETLKKHQKWLGETGLRHWYAAELDDALSCKGLIAELGEVI